MLATAGRRARGDDGHSTMLIHTSVKTDVHLDFKDPLRSRVDKLRKLVATGDESTLDRLRALWTSETAEVPAESFGLAPPLDFDEVQAQLPSVLDGVSIVIDNFRSEDRLDYSIPGQVAIAVGGNTLSRGLTLEGLTVSYFVRAAKAYDTLLQMARWFGFRPGYEDLPRIWMTEELRQWFRHLATVEHEIRLDTERYQSEDLTPPTEFGVRIRTHPTLRITAKMGAALPAYASYGGRRVQTRYFCPKDAEWLRHNVDAADGFVARVRTAGIEPDEPLENGAVIFRNVSADDVLRFLVDYKVHPDSPDLDHELIEKYVTKQRQTGHLDTWNLAVMAGHTTAHGSVRLGSLEFGRIVRSRLKDEGLERADIKTLMSKDHRAVDFMESAVARGLKETELAKARDADPVVRSKGLILLYPIDPHSEPEPANKSSRKSLDAVDDVIGMALVFPPGHPDESSQVRQTYVAVDLTDAEVEVEQGELDELSGQSDDE